MVFYFTTQDSNGNQFNIYMGRDKVENEDLIKYGFQEDLWFHVDKYSSAHVYLRLMEGQTMNDIPPEVLEDCCQLVKANSIEGCKLNDITIVYTPWSNLKKTNNMEVGQVGFHDEKKVKKYKIAEKKNNMILNRLNKTKVERLPNLAKEKEDRETREREKEKQKKKEQLVQDKIEVEKKKQEMDLKHYKSLNDPEKMTSNAAKTVEELEDDFW